MEGKQGTVTITIDEYLELLKGKDAIENNKIIVQETGNTSWTCSSNAFKTYYTKDDMVIKLINDNEALNALLRESQIRVRELEDKLYDATKYNNVFDKAFKKMPTRLLKKYGIDDYFIKNVSK